MSDRPDALLFGMWLVLLITTVAMISYTIGLGLYSYVPVQLFVLVAQGVIGVMLKGGKTL